MWVLLFYCLGCRAEPSGTIHLNAAACERAAEHVQPLLHGSTWLAECYPLQRPEGMVMRHANRSMHPPRRDSGNLPARGQAGSVRTRA